MEDLRNYLDQLGLTAQQQLNVLLAHTASIGADRAAAQYARHRVAEAGGPQGVCSYGGSAPERYYDLQPGQPLRGRAHPDSYPPGWGPG